MDLFTVSLSQVTFSLGAWSLEVTRAALQVAEAPRGPAGADVQLGWRVLCGGLPPHLSPTVLLLLYSNLSRAGGWVAPPCCGKRKPGGPRKDSSPGRGATSTVGMRAGQKPALSEGQVQVDFNLIGWGSGSKPPPQAVQCVSL